MAVLKAGRGALRMDLIDDDITGSASGDSTHIRVTFGQGWYNDFYGNFQFNQFGQVIGGTLLGVSYTLKDKVVYTLTDANTDAKAFFDLIGSGHGDEARALVLGGDDTLSGKNGDDYLIAYAGNDTIRGGGGNDQLLGAIGNDKLFGDDGSDRLNGGLGADKLDGGTGADIFVYASTDESTVGRAGRDAISNFSVAEGDKIDLSAIDAVAGGADDAFTFVKRFHGVAGELVVKETATGFLVMGDTDGINGADFSIVVTGAVAPDASSFVF